MFINDNKKAKQKKSFEEFIRLKLTEMIKMLLDFQFSERLITFQNLLTLQVTTTKI